jgi:sugar phosphate isomerase/epimerase
MTIPYCLNIHPGETLADVRDAITRHALRVRERLAPDTPYPLGLRFSAAAVGELCDSDTLALFRELLAANSLFVTGINGFPYGTFHGAAVKEAVYQPDWSCKQRVNYTMKLCTILSALLPEDRRGNVSTVPLGYKPQCDEDAVKLYLRNIAEMAEFLRALYENTGRRIALALEPEPDCVIENCAELIEWFSRFYDASEAARDYLGVCLDTCHFAVEFEDPLEVMRKLEQARIRIERVQLSSAVSATVSPESLNALLPFVDPVYLHQTRIRTPGGDTLRHPDLTAQVLSEALHHAGATLRTHFHVPLFFEGTPALQSTHDELSPAFLAHAVGKKYPLELETYTFDVLPRSVRPASIIDSLVQEHAWITARLPPAVAVAL